MAKFYTTTSIRLTQDEYELIQEHANKLGHTVTGLIMNWVKSLVTEIKAEKQQHIKSEQE